MTAKVTNEEMQAMDTSGRKEREHEAHLCFQGYMDWLDLQPEGVVQQHKDRWGIKNEQVGGRAPGGKLLISEEILIQISDSAEYIANILGFPEPNETGIPEGLQEVADEIGTIHEICFKARFGKDWENSPTLTKEENEMEYDPKTIEEVPCGTFTLFAAEGQFLSKIKQLMEDLDLDLSLYFEGEEIAGFESLLGRHEQLTKINQIYIIQAKKNDRA